ncbi:MAG TPA: sugar phosphate isomerase/epimerase [Terriglobales bacterium]|jgi:sugar phosphate isomerase/epimerase|nr:sugar phosphate isomerase/epimerase [Terriglobales bacterium]
MNRRQFVGTLGAAALASRFSWAANAHRIEKIGLELYTVRDALGKDFEGTLARVAKIGYKEVEFAGMFAKLPDFTPAPKHALEVLKANGLTAPATHVPYTALSPANWPKVIEASEIVGNKYIVNPSIDRELAKTADGWKKAAETFNRAGKESMRSGIHLGYHNHVEEFKPVDGKLPYDILLTECDPKLVVMEMDLGWAHKAGADPLAYFAKYPGRFPLVHVKDFDKDGNMTEVGKGVIDWKAIFAKADLGGIKHYFVEHDDPKDPFASAQTSYEYLEKLRF